MNLPDIRTIHTDTVIVGSGIAGLSAALSSANSVVISKTALGEGSSRWAQGGVAAAVGPDDNASLHAEDTLRVSAGLGVASVTEMVTSAARDHISWLRELGAMFDTDDDGELVLGREAGHSRFRIIHANGDATGAEIMRAMTTAVNERVDITQLNDTFVLDLLVDADGRVAGVLAIDADGQYLAVLALAVVLATGGIGRVYYHTTNPAEATGDGIAMAIRAGVAVRDLEFVQFHPTALHSTLDPMPLLTEALRGQGATLVNEAGERFMVDAHPDAELAPRDVVARHNFWQRQNGEVYLDARSIGPDFPTKFPTVFEIAQQVGLDPRVDLLTVAPADHYYMGGIACDAHGRTSMPGLFVAGEVSSSGLHGANRLASNSLLEGLVFGARVADAVTAVEERTTDEVFVAQSAFAIAVDAEPTVEVAAATTDLRRLMWDKVGLTRDEAGLLNAVTTLAEISPALRHDRTGRNLATVATAIAGAALQRCESRGSHHRLDFPNTDEVAEHTNVLPQSEPRVSILQAASSASGSR